MSRKARKGNPAIHAEFQTLSNVMKQSGTEVSMQNSNNLFLRTWVGALRDRETEVLNTFYFCQKQLKMKKKRKL